MSKQSKLAAWQSPAPTVGTKATPAIKDTPKVEKLIEALPVTEGTEVVLETKPEAKKIKKTKTEG